MTARNAPPIVVTRPIAQAEPLAQRIAAMGRETIVFPLLEILSLPDQAPLQSALRNLDRYAMAAFVSPNAINSAFAHIDAWPSRVAIGVVGEGSKSALANHGVTPANATIFSPSDPRRTDSQTLLEVLDLEALRGHRVLIVRGETGRELLSDALRAHGVQVEQVAAYRRAAPVLDQDRGAQLSRLLDRRCDWIITSSEALRNLLQMVRDVAGDAGIDKVRRQKLIVPHVRIAETAHELGFVDVMQTGSGDEQLLAALKF